ncbi:MAG: pyridoxine 5'-phosphate synthase [Planctomycetota bacterium]
MPAALSVNVNKIALLRNSRPLPYPDPAALSRLALDAGAAGITVHPRPDARHIRPDDVTAIAALLAEPAYAGRELNIEGNPFEGRYLDHITDTQPTQATLVPDDPNQSTSDHGWDVAGNLVRLRDVVAEVRQRGAQRVSLFVDADRPDDVARVAETGADRVELYTQPYAEACDAGHPQPALDTFAAAAQAARAVGLGVNAGHDLTLENLPLFLTRVPGVAEVSIGHALVADALRLGMAETVARYLAVCR